MANLSDEFGMRGDMIRQSVYLQQKVTKMGLISVCQNQFLILASDQFNALMIDHMDR